MTNRQNTKKYDSIKIQMNKLTTSLASLALATAACSGAQTERTQDKCEISSKTLTNRLIDIENAVRTAKIEKRTNGYISDSTKKMIRELDPKLYDEQILMEGECEKQKPTKGTSNIRNFEFRTETIRQEIRDLGILPQLPFTNE